MDFLQTCFDHLRKTLHSISKGELSVLAYWQSTSATSSEIMSLEAVKYMMFCLVLYYSRVKDTLPVWVGSFFADKQNGDQFRPSDYLCRELNRLGKDQGLSEVELVLLSETLRTQIYVYDLNGLRDFHNIYAPEQHHGFAKIVVISEDGKHYNALSHHVNYKNFEKKSPTQ